MAIYRITTTGYVPAHINLDSEIVTGQPWTWERLISFFIGEANLCRQELYRGKCILVSISLVTGPLSSWGDPTLSDSEPMITYKVTGSLTKGFNWRVAA